MSDAAQAHADFIVDCYCEHTRSGSACRHCIAKGIEAFADTKIAALETQLAAERKRADEAERELRRVDSFKVAHEEIRKAEAERDAARDKAERLERECQRFQEREQHFAKALAVADGGQYRADWDGAIAATVRERNELRARVGGLEQEVAQAKAAIDRAEKNGDWAAIYNWLDKNKDVLTKKISDHNGELERQVVALEKKLVDSKKIARDYCQFFIDRGLRADESPAEMWTRLLESRARELAATEERIRELEARELARRRDLEQQGVSLVSAAIEIMDLKRELTEERARAATLQQGISTVLADYEARPEMSAHELAHRLFYFAAPPPPPASGHVHGENCRPSCIDEEDAPPEAEEPRTVIDFGNCSRCGKPWRTWGTDADPVAELVCDGGHSAPHPWKAAPTAKDVEPTPTVRCPVRMYDPKHPDANEFGMRDCRLPRGHWKSAPTTKDCLYCDRTDDHEHQFIGNEHADDCAACCAPHPPTGEGGGKGKR